MAETIGEMLRRATADLMGKSGSPRLDAQLILAHVLDKPREYLIAHDEQALSDLQSRTFDALLTLRTKGMPVGYILGQRPFYDRVFKVTPHVLIPRPETEHIVEAALEWAKGRTVKYAVDVGTGSGAIAVTLAAQLLGSRVIATDVSHAALVVARENAADLTNIHFVQADLLMPLHGLFDIIAANLPYIATDEVDVLEVARFEPHVALNGGVGGLTLIQRLLQQAPARLTSPGLLLLEIGAEQGAAVTSLAGDAFPTASVSILKDYANLDRVVRVEQ
jgi:release factor glutamine methyltransferase